MAYNIMAQYYDGLNIDADYEQLSIFIRRRLSFFRMHGCTIVDLCCGTGELTLLLSASGYDMIAVDNCPEMLSVLSNKIHEREIKGILLLCQDARELDLFGTVDCMVCTFDALNHIGDMSELEKVFERVALFLKPQGIFIFDMNTPYKHVEVLAHNSYKYEDKNGVNCFVSHTLCDGFTKSVVNICTEKRSTLDTLTEYYFDEQDIRRLCSRHGLNVVSCIDGETFEKLRPESERYMFTVQKTKK